MKKLFNWTLASIACLSICSCNSSTPSSTDSKYVSVQIEDSKMWSLLDVNDGQIVMADEFFAPSSNVVKGSFFVENDNQEFDLYNLQDTKNKLNRSSYSVVSNFNKDGFAITRVKDEPWQIIDTEGNTIATLDKNLMVLSGFSDEGMALVMNQDEMLGYVNTQGQNPIKPRYKFATIFSDGVAFVLTKQEENHNYLSAIDPQGNTLFTFSDAKYSDVGLFQDGYMFAVEGDHSVLLDKSGKKIMNVCNGTDIAKLAYKDGKVIYFDGQYYGVKNLEDKILIRAKYKSLKFQSDGKLVAKNTSDKYGIVNSDDEIYVPFDYDELYYIAPDRYITKTGNVYVMINEKGKEICDKAFASFMNRTESASETGITNLISSSNNSAPSEQDIENFLLNLLNLQDNSADFNYNMEEGGFEGSDMSDGLNVFHGSFNFEGAEYPFEVNFNYDVATHTVLDATYVAVGTGSKNKINSMIFSADEKVVTIEGPGLYISATLGANGKYQGTMTRGTHSGTIEMSL